MKSLSIAELERRRNLPLIPLKHGMYNTPEYYAWSAMKQRCQNPKHPCFPLYGARGIKVCSEWSSFDAFFNDMGPRPAGGTLERIDNSKGYSPENCAWRTQSQQMRNTRRNVFVSIRGKTKCLKDWCLEFGMIYGTILGRLRRGWNTHAALTTPVKTQYRKHNYGH